MKNITVDIACQNIQYEIIFSDSVLHTLEKNIPNISQRKIFFVIDDFLFGLYKDLVEELEKRLNITYMLIQHGEKNKNYKTVFKIIDALIEQKTTRNDYIVSLGGGVTGDMTGFACNLFKRGVKLIQIPTTLLSMIDSSVGGKTGIDYKGIKNLVGTFYNPECIFINKNFLHTLSKKELLSGMFEGIKHSILSSRKDFLDFSGMYDTIMSQEEDANTDLLIKKNIEHKLQVVRSDPFELYGKRNVLNYGHTFGHALETISNFKIPHGICVGFGILFANILAHQKGFLDTEVYHEISTVVSALLRDFHLKNLDFEIIFDLMLNDKKNSSKQVKCILIKTYGEYFEFDATRQDLEETFTIFVDSISN